MSVSKRRACRAAAASSLALAALLPAGVQATAVEQEKNPWRVTNSRVKDWGDGRSFTVRQWSHDAFPDWVFVEATADALPVMMAQEWDGSVKVSVGTPSVWCEPSGEGRLSGEADAGRTTATGAWWIKKGAQVECGADLGSGEPGDVGSIGMRAGGALSVH